MQIRADYFEQVLNIAVVGEASICMDQLFPIKGMVDQMIEYGFSIYRVFQPVEVARGAQVIARAADDGRVIDGVPGTDGCAADVIRSEMLVHVLREPDLNDIAQRRWIQQRETQTSERRVPGERERRECVAT